MHLQRGIFRNDPKESNEFDLKMKIIADFIPKKEDWTLAG